MRRRNPAAGVRLALLLPIALLALPAGAAVAAVPLYPDLIADAPGAPATEVYDDGSGDRLLLRFEGYVHNIGPGALEIRASDPSGLAMTDVKQRIYDSAGGVFKDMSATRQPEVLYETEDSHDHWHLKHAARYSLWNLARTAEVAPAQKAGFCLEDSQWIGDGTRPKVYTNPSFCEQRNPEAASVMMGISAGFRDVYARSLAFQWVDVSDVPPGRYWMAADVDPDGTVLEQDEVNPRTFTGSESVVPGYLAGNVDEPFAHGPREVQLTAATFGSPGPRQFKIVRGPEHGALDRPAGTWFADATVEYSPDPGYTGPDSFTFAASDSSSNFPRTPVSAVATLEGNGPVLVSVAGAPERLQTGTGAQLSAVVENDAPDVTWSVDGVVGGNASVGTISPDGLYQAPAAVPPAGQVRVAARSASGAVGEAVIGIVYPPAPRPAPDVPGAVPAAQPVEPPGPQPAEPPGAVLGTKRKSSPLSRLRFARHGKRLLVSLKSATAGRVVVRASKRGRRIGHCAARVSTNRRMTCAIRLNRLRARAALVCRLPRTRRLRLPGVRVSATLYVRGHKKAVRRARVR